jgi:hypothetical protein
VFAADVYLHKRLYQHAIIAYRFYTHGQPRKTRSTLLHKPAFIQRTTHQYSKKLNCWRLGVGFKGIYSTKPYPITWLSTWCMM